VWHLFHLDQELSLYRAHFIADSKHARLCILCTTLSNFCISNGLAMLTLLCSGFTPKNQGESNLIWDNALYLTANEAIFEV
jgi:hypothetical protein